MRNILSYVSKKNKLSVAGKLKLIWQAPDVNMARKLMNDFVKDYKSQYPKEVDCLIDGFKGSIQFYLLKYIEWI